MATAQQIASPGVYVSDDVGLEVTDGSNSRVQLGLLPTGTYGLRVVTAGGSTVIIDGTSDMFKIAATGTLQTPLFAAPGFSQATVTLATGFTYNPITVFSLQSGVGAVPVYYAIWDTGTGLMNDSFEGLAVVASGNQTKVTVQSTTHRAGGLPAYNYRYYVLQEEAI